METWELEGLGGCPQSPCQEVRSGTAWILNPNSAVTATPELWCLPSDVCQTLPGFGPNLVIIFRTQKLLAWSPDPKIWVVLSKNEQLFLLHGNDGQISLPRLSLSIKGCHLPTSLASPLYCRHSDLGSEPLMFRAPSLQPQCLCTCCSAGWNSYP